MAVGAVLIGARRRSAPPPCCSSDRRPLREAQNVSRDLPNVANELGDVPIIGETLRKNDVPAKIDQFLRELPTRLGQDDEPVVTAVQAVLGGALAGADDRARHRRPAARRPPGRCGRCGGSCPTSTATASTGRRACCTAPSGATSPARSSWPSSPASTSSSSGLALGVALAPLAALWTTLTNLIPQIGGFLGGSFFVLLAFAHSPTAGVICLVEFLLYQQLENHVIQPTIVGEAVDLSPPITMIAALVGASAAGVPGALVAVPLLGAAKVLALELRPPPAGREPKPPPAPASALQAPVRARSMDRSWRSHSWTRSRSASSSTTAPSAPTSSRSICTPTTSAAPISRGATSTSC